MTRISGTPQRSRIAAASVVAKAASASSSLSLSACTCASSAASSTPPSTSGPFCGQPQRPLRVERDAAASGGERGQHLGPEVAAALRARVHPGRVAHGRRGPARDVVLAPGDADAGQRVVALAVLAVAQLAHHDRRDRCGGRTGRPARRSARPARGRRSASRRRAARPVPPGRARRRAASRPGCARERDPAGTRRPARSIPRSPRSWRGRIRAYRGVERDMRRATSFPMLAAERLPGKVRAGAIRLLIACLAIWGLGMLSPEIDRDRALVVLIAGWGVIIAALLVLVLGTQRVLHRLDVPLLGAGRRARRGADRGVAPRRPRAARARVLPVLDADLHRRLALAAGRRLQGPAGDADVLGLLLLLRLDRLREPAGRHHRRQQGRAHGDHDRAAHGHGGAGRLPRLVPRLRHRGRSGGRRGRARRPDPPSA